MVIMLPTVRAAQAKLALADSFATRLRKSVARVVASALSPTEEVPTSPSMVVSIVVVSPVSGSVSVVWFSPRPPRLVVLPSNFSLIVSR